MASPGDLEKQFQERIARAKEAARLTSIAVTARGASEPNATTVTPRWPPPPQPPSAPLGFRGPPPHPACPPPVAPPPPPIVTVPDDVRHRIDRLVEFIARNGPAFEATARERERDNPDFAFLHAGAPFHEYFIWKKAQSVAKPPPPAPTVPSPVTGALPPRPLGPSGVDPVMNLSVGAMANACKAARARRLPQYAPLPPDLLVPSGAVVPPVEPARLEARLVEFYALSGSS